MQSCARSSAGPARPAFASQIVRRSIDRELLLIDAARDDATVGRMADAHHGVDARADEIGVLVGQPQLEAQLRVRARKLREHREHDLFPVGHRHIDAQHAGGRLRGAGGERVERFELFQDAPAARMERLALLRERDAPRGALEEPQLHLLFEPLHALRDGRGRQSQLARGAREAALLRGFAERLQQLQAVSGHC